MKLRLLKIVLWFKGLRRLWVLTTVEDNLNSLVFQVKDNKTIITYMIDDTRKDRNRIKALEERVGK